MRKVITILVVVFCTPIFTSCTDEATELEERIEYERHIELQLITPGDDGSVDDEDYRE